MPGGRERPIGCSSDQCQMAQIWSTRCACLGPISQAASVLSNRAVKGMSALCNLEGASSDSALSPARLEITQRSLFKQELKLQFRSKGARKSLNLRMLIILRFWKLLRIASWQPVTRKQRKLTHLKIYCSSCFSQSFFTHLECRTATRSLPQNRHCILFSNLCSQGSIIFEKFMHLIFLICESCIRINIYQARRHGSGWTEI